MKIFSKVDKSKIILSILRFQDINDIRTDISPENEFIQTSGIVVKKNFEIKLHKHNKIKRETDLTQETWIILKGKIAAKFYDIDDKFIHQDVFQNGDCVTIFRGGHELKVLEDNTYFYEIKNGPYLGVKKDKTSFNEK